MATHSSVLAWRIPWTEKPGRLQSMGSHRVGHDWSDLAAITNDIEHFSMYLLAIYIASLENYLSRFFAHFCLGYLSFYFWDIGVFIYSVSEKPINPPWFTGKQPVFQIATEYLSQNEKEEKNLCCILFSRNDIFKIISIFKHLKKRIFIYSGYKALIGHIIWKQDFLNSMDCLCTF